MNIQKMMQQAQEMQTRMQELQERLAEVEVKGESGGGLVQVTMTCRGEVRSVTISPDVIDANDKETLEDLVAAAMNMVRQSADTKMALETQKLMEEMGLPTEAAGGMLG